MSLTSTWLVNGVLLESRQKSVYISGRVMFEIVRPVELSAVLGNGGI